MVHQGLDHYMSFQLDDGLPLLCSLLAHYQDGTMREWYQPIIAAGRTLRYLLGGNARRNIVPNA